MIRLYKTEEGAKFALKKFKERGLDVKLRKSRSKKSWVIVGAPPKKNKFRRESHDDWNVENQVTDKFLRTGDFHTFGYPDSYWKD